MRVLLTGANGYIGMRLLPLLVKAGHIVICCVRNPKRFYVDQELRKQIEVIKVSFHDFFYRRF